MQIFTIDMIINAVGIYIEFIRKITTALFAATYQNIGLSFDDLFHSDHKLVSGFVLVATTVFFVRLAKARKLAFLDSLFDK